MARLRVHAFSISLDGYGAGPNQDMKEPLGVGGESLHNWIFGTRHWKQRIKQEGGSLGPDNDFLDRGFAGIGAWIMGRNMFGPVRGPWPDESWQGWWGRNPPYHVPVFVLTRHPRPVLRMEGNTEFHFVTGGIHEALKRAQDAAGSSDIRLGGGASVIRQYLQAGLVDEMHVAVAPVLLGSGVHLLSDIDLLALGYACTEHVATASATHFVVTKAVGGGSSHS
jgi:dihydrofolate reductase